MRLPVKRSINPSTNPYFLQRVSIAERCTIYDSFCPTPTILAWYCVKTTRRIDNKKSLHIAEKADRTALSRIAVQHADDGYSRRINFGGTPVHSVLMYAPNGINVWFKSLRGYFTTNRI